MCTENNERLMRAAFAPARCLEPSEADVAQVLDRVGTPARRTVRFPARGGWRRLAAPSLAAFALLVSGLYAVPATRAAIDDVAGTFVSWASGDSADAPGRPLREGEDLPSYLYGAYFGKEVRVAAEAGGYKLFAYVEPSGGIGFDLGATGVGGGVGAAEIDDHAVYVLGPGIMENAGDPNHPARQFVDPAGHVPLFGLAADSVASVELTYDSGPALRLSDVSGGFVLLVEPSRGPREVVAFDAQDEVIGRQLIDHSAHAGPRIDWSEYVPRG